MGSPGQTRHLYHYVKWLVRFHLRLKLAGNTVEPRSYSHFNEKGKILTPWEMTQKFFWKVLRVVLSSFFLNTRCILCWKFSTMAKTTVENLVAIGKFFNDYGFSVFQFAEIRVFTFSFKQKPTKFMITVVLCFWGDYYLI